MTWPRPPRRSPAPPESIRYSFFQMTSGVVASLTSVEVVLTPDGNAVVDSPSFATRAPVPPLKIGLVTKDSARTLPVADPGASMNTGFHMQDAPSAGIWSGIT